MSSADWIADPPDTSPANKYVNVSQTSATNAAMYIHESVPSANKAVIAIIVLDGNRVN